MIELAAVRYFRKVTECGSIKQAAASLRIAPSAISRQVQAIEDELAVKLFERGARGMVLTDAGQLLYRYAVENRNQLDDIRAKVQEFDPAPPRTSQGRHRRRNAGELPVEFCRRPRR